MSHAKREVGAACALLLFQRRSRDNRLVGRTVARVSAEEHMANYQAARTLMGKANSELRNSSRAGSVRERGSSAKKAPGSPR
jgi:hypothetical protein